MARVGFGGCCCEELDNAEASAARASQGTSADSSLSHVGHHVLACTQFGEGSGACLPSVSSTQKGIKTYGFQDSVDFSRAVACKNRPKLEEGKRPPPPRQDSASGLY